MREDGMELRVNLSRKRAKENVRKGGEEKGNGEHTIIVEVFNTVLDDNPVKPSKAMQQQVHRSAYRGARFRPIRSQHSGYRDPGPARSS
jgi:hypothetical protein